MIPSEVARLRQGERVLVNAALGRRIGTVQGITTDGRWVLVKFWWLSRWKYYDDVLGPITLGSW